MSPEDLSCELVADEQQRHELAISKVLPPELLSHEILSHVEVSSMRLSTDPAGFAESMGDRRWGDR